jgi:hypothetical protein
MLSSALHAHEISVCFFACYPFNDLSSSSILDGNTMIERRDFLRTLAVTSLTYSVVTQTAAKTTQTTSTTEQASTAERAYWVDVLTRLANPFLTNLAEQRLKERMPVEAATGLMAERRDYTHLEALGRLLAGIAPWLELDSVSGEEGQLREQYSALARRALDAATDPSSRDFMNFTKGGQPLVDTAFLAQAILRAPKALWSRLDARTQSNVITALKATRVIKPGFSNWLMFSAMIEAALASLGQQWDQMRVDYAVRQHEQWYKGDGTYGDGPEFHWDYYNSFVIQPMLIDVLGAVAKQTTAWSEFYQRVLTRARRYAVIQERMISPEGTFPAIGRSITYRFGAFHLLGQLALMRQLPTELKPSQVRYAMTAVIRRMIEAPGTFDKDGWLTIGFCGHQPSLGERYISTGSLYLCSVGLLPLGLPAADDFWSGRQLEWTAKRIWSGQDMPADHAL